MEKAPRCVASLGLTWPHETSRAPSGVASLELLMGWPVEILVRETCRHYHVPFNVIGVNNPNTSNLSF